MKKDISTKQFIREFESEINRLGGVTEAAKHWKVSPSFVKAVRKGSELPGGKILEAMKLKPIKTIKYRYERID